MFFTLFAKAAGGTFVPVILSCVYDGETAIDNSLREKKIQLISSNSKYLIVNKLRNKLCDKPHFLLSQHLNKHFIS